jgi:hypothetical protein
MNGQFAPATRTGRMRRTALTLLCTPLLGLALAGAAHAGAITVPVDHLVKLPLAGPAGSVVVGNPAVADVMVVDSRTVFVNGKGPGSTDVTVVDPLGRTVFTGGVRVVAEAGSHVVIQRGAKQRADLSCDPTCIPASAPSASAIPNTPAPSAAALVSGATVGAVTGAVSGGLQALGKPS